MTTFDHELTGRYVSAGADRPSPDDRRIARAVFVRDTPRTTCDADQMFGIAQPTSAASPSSSMPPKSTSSSSAKTSASES